MNVLQQKSQEVSQRNRQNNLKTLMKIMNTIEIDILLHELKLAIGNHIFHFYMGGGFPCNIFIFLQPEIIVLTSKV